MKKQLFIIAISVICTNLSSHAQRISIDTTVNINIGGIKQVVRLKGNDITKSILLYLHGSGSNSYSIISQADKLTANLQEYFVVALWDRREHGQTYALNKSQEHITLQLVVDDTKEVIDYLLEKYNRQQLFLVGHSMGSALGMYIAYKFSELLHALVQMSPPVDGVGSQRIGLEKLKKHFKQLNNQRAINELAAVESPTTDFDQQFIQYVWQTEYDGEHVTDEMRAQGKPILEKMMEYSGQLINEVNALNYTKQFPAIKCPVYFFTGRKDFTTNSVLTWKYYQQLSAPKKEFFWFEKSGHQLPYTESELMQELIISDVLGK